MNFRNNNKKSVILEDDDKETKKPLVSVIIPIFNAEKFLKKTIDSVINQSYQNIEIILVNDGSSDCSKEICLAFLDFNSGKKSSSLLSNNVSSVRKQNFKKIKFFDIPHGGVSSARNYGLSKITGDFFCFIDADDALRPDFITVLLDFALKNQLDYVTSGYTRYVVSSRKGENFNADGTVAIFDRITFLKKMLNLEDSYNFCHMKLINSKFKKMNFDESLLVAEDALYNFSLFSQLDRIGVINRPLYVYNVHEKSTVRTFSPKYVSNYRRSLKKIESFLFNHFSNDIDEEEIKTLFYAFVVSHLFLILVNFCCHESNKRKLFSIRQVVKDPFFAKAIRFASLSAFSHKKAIVLVCFKFRLYPILFLIGRLRSVQNLKK